MFRWSMRWRDGSTHGTIVSVNLLDARLIWRCKSSLARVGAILPLKQPHLTNPKIHRLLHRPFGGGQGVCFPVVVPRLPAVHAVPLVLGAELDGAHLLFSGPVAVGVVAAFPDGFDARTRGGAFGGAGGGGFPSLRC